MSAAAIPSDLRVVRGPAIMPLDRRLMGRAAGIVGDRVPVQIELDSCGVDGKTPNRTGDIVRQIVRASLRQITARC